jgi:site-specific DNA recombinase
MTDDEYQKIEALLLSNAKDKGWKPAKAPKTNPLSGLVYCGECRGYCPSMPYKHRSEDPLHNYHYCKARALQACSQKRSVKGYAIEAAIVEALISRGETLSAIANEPAVQETSELQVLRAELAYYQDAPGHRAAEIVADIQQQIVTVQQQQAITGASRDQQGLLLQVFEDPLYWKTLPNEEKKQIYQALVERVVVRNGRVERVELKV